MGNLWLSGCCTLYFMNIWRVTDYSILPRKQRAAIERRFKEFPIHKNLFVCPPLYTIHKLEEYSYGIETENLEIKYCRHSGQCRFHVCPKNLFKQNPVLSIMLQKGLQGRKRKVGMRNVFFKKNHRQDKHYNNNNNNHNGFF